MPGLLSDFESNGNNVELDNLSVPPSKFGVIVVKRDAQQHRLSVAGEKPRKPELYLKADHPSGIPAAQWLFYPDLDFDLPPGIPDLRHPMIYAYCVPKLINGDWLYTPLYKKLRRYFWKMPHHE